jgi:GDP-L-fucose synthase
MVILVTGASGMLGKEVVKCLTATSEYEKSAILTPDRDHLNLLDLNSCIDFFEKFKPSVVYHLAAKVMGLPGNLELQTDSFVTNSLINSNLFQAMIKHPPKKIFFAGTAAAYSYPYKHMPLKEEDFLDGDVHDGEFGYAWSKRVAYPWLRILRDECGSKIVYGVLTNLFGPNDRFKGPHTHVIPALIHRAHECASQGNQVLEVWGFPTTTRDFLFSEEAARVIVNLVALSNWESNYFFVNIGSGIETSMRKVVEIISGELGLDRVNWLHEKPVGVQKRYLDITKLNSLGIHSNLNFVDQLTYTMKWYRANLDRLR